MAAALSLMLAAFLAVFTARLLLADAALERRLVRLPVARAAAGLRELAPTAGSSRRPTGASAAIRWTMRFLNGSMLVFLLIVGLGPILWMLKSAITPTQDTLRQPMALWPHGFDLGAARDGLEQGPHRPLPVQHGRDRVRVVGSSRSSSRRRPASRCRPPAALQRGS